MAATTRTITDTIYKMDGTPWAGATVRINRVDRPMIDADGTIGDSVATGTTDENGDVTLAVAVPPSGAGRYLLTRPVETGRPVDVTYFYLAAGDPISVGEILAASASALTEDAVLTLLSAYLSKANNLSDLASAATARTNLGLGTAATADTGDFEAAGAVAAHTGDSSAAHAASAISVTPAGGVTATDVQAALTELQDDIDGMGGGASDVDDLTTTTGSSSQMLRVAAAGGLEYRTTAQVLGDIGAAPTASPTFTGTVTLPATVASVIKPASDSTTALQLANAAGTAVLTVDTTNRRITLGSIVPVFKFSIDGPNSDTDGPIIGMYGSAINQVESGRIRFGESSALPYQGAYIQYNGAINALIIGRNQGVTAAADVPVLRIERGSSQVAIGHGTAPTAYADLAASTTAAASLRIRSGTAPTSPNAGDIWFNGTSLMMYDGATTRTISWT